jgi:two-component system, sensor histidine kinase LadS
MSAQGAARDFVRAMFESRPDPYEGGEISIARPVTAALVGLSSLLALVMLSFEPPTAAFGAGGWALAVAIVLAGFAAAVLVARREPGFDDLLIVAYAGVVAVGVLNWLAGGGSSGYSELFVLLVGAAGTHPPRRAFPYLAALVAVLWAPLVYGEASGHAVRMLGAESLVLVAIGCVLISYLFYVRQQRSGLRAGAEVARRLARIDALTGLGNRRALDQALTSQAASSSRGGSPLSVALVDLDGLKRINDRFGHLEGDRCLQEAARAMERSVRGSDLCFRWGGDEFVVLMPTTDRPGAEQVLARMAEDVGRVCPREGEPGLTLSYGVAELQEGASAEDLLAMADLALMEQKTEKRR